MNKFTCYMFTLVVVGFGAFFFGLKQGYTEGKLDGEKQAIVKTTEEVSNGVDEAIEQLEVVIKQLGNHRTLLNAMFIVESSSGKNLVGDNGDSIGPYQIQKAYWQDATEFSKIGGTYQDCMNKEYSEKIIVAYAKRYEKKAFQDMNYEVLAKLHNGGPSWRRYKSDTQKYWEKIQKNM